VYNSLVFFSVLLIALLNMRGDGRADLLWNTTQITLRANSEDKAESATFLFQNGAPYAIKIIDVKTSCGCTTADLTKRNYAPGEKGALNINYSIGNQTGLQRKTIIVSTNDVSHSIYRLLLNVDVPELLKMSTRYVVWNVGDNLDSQFIELSAKPTTSVQVISVTSDSLNINAVLRILDPGKRYSIQVTPTTTETEARGTLVIETNLQQDGHNRKFFAYADVRPRPRTKPTLTN
jgi:Protein of unknown function (DUF1573)